MSCARVFASHFCTHKAKNVTILYVSLYNIAITSEIDRKTHAVRIHYPDKSTCWSLSIYIFTCLIYISSHLSWRSLHVQLQKIHWVFFISLSIHKSRYFMNSAFRFSYLQHQERAPSVNVRIINPYADFRAKSIAEFLRYPERSSCVYNSPKPTRNFSSRHSWSHSILETLIASDNAWTTGFNRSKVPSSGLV